MLAKVISAQLNIGGLTMENDVHVMISEETKEKMIQFFLKTSIPRILEKEKESQEVRTKQE
jgi:hypothetical protein